MNNNKFLIPKDSFSELLLGLAKEKCIFEHKKAKSDLFIKESLADRVDDYFLDTLVEIDEHIKFIEDMELEEFVNYLFYSLKGNNLDKVNYDKVFQVLDLIIPKPEFFVDRGYERHTA